MNTGFRSWNKPFYVCFFKRLCCFRNTCHELEQVTEPSKLGEGLHWDADAEMLYFVDITSRTINAYNPKTEKHTFTKVGKL